MRRASEALSDCEKALAMRPHTSAFHDSCGLGHFILGDLVRARTDYDEAIRLDPKSPWQVYGRAMVREATGDFAGAEEDFTAARALAVDGVAWAQVERDLGQFRKKQ
jgi:Flp pilus assembly protein TadD